MDQEYSGKIMTNILKKAVYNLMDKAFTSECYVLGVRAWKPSGMYEIDIHIPGTDMHKWSSIQRIKCKVRNYGEYRDYTPTCWDAEKRICTVFIEADHQGCGSLWVKNLEAGDTILLAVAHAASLPGKPGKIVCFGDGSALGHFLALKQLTDRKDYNFEAVVFLNEEYTLPESFSVENPEFRFLMKPGEESLESLLKYSEGKMLQEYTSIYIAGYIPMVSGLRKAFKRIPNLNAKIFAHGFWS